MQKPYVIIHTHTSIDGKINFIDVPEFKTATRQYQEIALDPHKQQLNIQGYLNGRRTTDDNITDYRKPDLNPDALPVPEGDYIADVDASMYYVSIDPKGVLGWQTNSFEYGNVTSFVIEVITGKVSNAYKDFLRRMKISYIIAGDEELDKELMLHKLVTLFKMERIMIGGGGTLNWSFVYHGLVDEISIIMAPIANGSTEMPSLFMAQEPLSQIKPTSFKLLSVEALEDSTVWLRYKVNN